MAGLRQEHGLNFMRIKAYRYEPPTPTPNPTPLYNHSSTCIKPCSVFLHHPTAQSPAVSSVRPTSPQAGPAEPSTLQPSYAPSPWRRMTFFPTGSHIVPASPHARGPGTLQQAEGTSKAGRPTAAACRSSSQLQFVIIIKGLTSEASLPLFTPPSHP
ncbi:hypothetical protein Q8A73_006826 [Channa argus]|nr:hypothetical protein Q8A73_006826 [Channa argus]